MTTIELDPVEHDIVAYVNRCGGSRVPRSLLTTVGPFAATHLPIEIDRALDGLVEKKVLWIELERVGQRMSIPPCQQMICLYPDYKEQDVKKSDAFPGNYLGKDDLPVTATIRTVEMEEVQSGNKKDLLPVVYFQEQHLKAFILNNTNWDTIEAAYGPDTDMWVNRQIYVYWDPTIKFGKETTGGRRVQIPQPGMPQHAQHAPPPQQNYQPPPAQNFSPPAGPNPGTITAPAEAYISENQAREIAAALMAAQITVGDGQAKKPFFGGLMAQLGVNGLLQLPLSRFPEILQRIQQRDPSFLPPAAAHGNEEIPF